MKFEARAIYQSPSIYIYVFSVERTNKCSLLVSNTVSPLCENPVESRVISFYPWHAAGIVTFDLLVQRQVASPTMEPDPLQVSRNVRQRVLDFPHNDARNKRFLYTRHSDRIPRLHSADCPVTTGVSLMCPLFLQKLPPFDASIVRVVQGAFAKNVSTLCTQLILRMEIFNKNKLLHCD